MPRPIGASRSWLVASVPIQLRAAESSERPWLSQLTEPKRLAALLAAREASIFAARGKQESLGAVVMGPGGHALSAHVTDLAGPEGHVDAEVNHARQLLGLDNALRELALDRGVLEVKGDFVEDEREAALCASDQDFLFHHSGLTFFLFSCLPHSRRSCPVALGIHAFPFHPSELPAFLIHPADAPARRPSAFLLPAL
jgi:hypothetical protein